MRDYWNDPPEPVEIPECCGFEMKEIQPNAIMCMTCGRAIYVQPDIGEPPAA